MNHIASIGFALMAASMAAMSASLNFIDGTNVVIRATNNGPVISVQINAASTGGAPTISDQIQFTEAFSRVLIQSGGGQDTLWFQAADGFGATNDFARMSYDYLDPENTFIELFGQVRLRTNAPVGWLWGSTNLTGAGDWVPAYYLPLTNSTAYDFSVSSDGVTLRDGGGNIRARIYAHNTDYGALIISNASSATAFKFGGTVPELYSVARLQDVTNNVVVINLTNIVDSTGSAGVTGRILKKSAGGVEWGEMDTNWDNLNITNLYAGSLFIDTNLSTNTVTTRLTVSEIAHVPQIKYSLAVSNVHSGAATNFTLNTDLAKITIYATNGFTLTNFSALETGEGTTAKYVDMTVIGCSNAMPLVTLPTLGGSSYGIRVWTNDSKPVITLLTNGVRVRYSWEFTGTNATLINCATF
jgi:hypothetical protein